MGTHTPPQMPGKIPVQDPKSPLRDLAPTFNLMKPRLAPREAKSPAQVTSDGEKSLDSGEGGTLKDRPVQESVNAKDSVDKTLSGLVQFTGEQVSNNQPVNKREEVKSKEEATREQPVVRTEDFPPGIEGFNEEKLLQETNQPGKDDVREEHPLQPFEEFEKEKPIQETKEPSKDDRRGDKSFEDTEKQKPLQESTGNETEGLSESKPLQETANDAVETKSTVKEEVRPTQVTMSLSTGFTEESDQDKSKSLQETGEPSQRQEAEVENTEEIQTSHDVSSADNPDSKRSKQETVSSEANSDSLKEEAVPTQETMAAGKGPFEESGLEVGVKAHPTDEVRDVPPAGNPESIQPKQETASPDKESDSLNEEVVPTQETMAAGKGPFEESGLEVGVKAHPTDGERGGPPEGNPESIQPKQETASSCKESNTLNEEVVPTQETMAAGKGPFEESGLEVGVKAHPRDEVHDVPPAENPESIQLKQETASSEKESGSLNEEAVPTQETMASCKGPLEESGIEVRVKAHPTDERE